MSADNLRRVVGRYSIFGPIASGGMATVHYGRLNGPVGFSRTVAVKRMHQHLAAMPILAASFVDEARLAARVKHPNVVPTIDVLHEEDEVLLVMEYVHGVSLSDLIDAAVACGERVPVKTAASIVCGMLHGLHAAHEAKDEQGASLGLVHRDVSPQNVLVGTDGVARVVDFGVAKARGRIQTTQEGQLKGKLPYMSPEQLLSMELTRQTDVYAAAVVLWETLACRRLFDAESEGALVKQILDGTVEPASRHATDLPEGVEAIVRKGLARNLSERFRSAKEMAVALEAEAGLTPAWQVGEWVERLGQVQLAKRQAKVDATERDEWVEDADEPVSLIPTATNAGPATTAAITVRDIRRAPDVAPNPTTGAIPREKRQWLWLALAGAVLFGLVLGAWSWLRPPEPVALPVVTASNVPAAAVIVTSSPTPSETASAASPAPTPSARVTKPRRAAPTKNCDPPYTEKNGIRYPKPGCM
jgi:eukaryotic-like serine/threonine-protein kinase